MNADMFGWRHCPECPEGDSEWPAECFDAERGMCKACAHANPRRVRRPCARCGRTVETLDRVAEPKCRPCRGTLRGLATPHRRAKKRAWDRRNYQRTKRATYARAA